MPRYRDAEWRGSMRIRLDYNNMMTDFLGERGIAPAEVEGLLPMLKDALSELARKREKGETAWRDLPTNQETVVRKIEKIAQEIRDSFDTFVALGIGGSALGPIAVQQALNHPHYNELADEDREGPRLYVVDNIDPEKMQALWDVVDPETTCFNVITKSGSTSETMSQFLIVADLLKDIMGEGWQEHIVATTDAEKGNLIKIARQEGFTTLVVPDGVGGRFSELCPVGLLPAAVCGIDIRELLAGAAYMDEFCSDMDPAKNPAAIGAALMYIAMNNGKNISVMMPYADSLKYIAAWYAQLWAESLGKKVDVDGNVVNAGQTPVAALGVTDQAFPGPALHRGPLRQDHHIPHGGPVPGYPLYPLGLRGHPRGVVPGGAYPRRIDPGRTGCHRVRPGKGGAPEPHHRYPRGQRVHHRPASLPHGGGDRRYRGTAAHQYLRPAWGGGGQERHLRTDGQAGVRGEEERTGRKTPRRKTGTYSKEQYIKYKTGSKWSLSLFDILSGDGLSLIGLLRKLLSDRRCALITGTYLFILSKDEFHLLVLTLLH